MAFYRLLLPCMAALEIIESVWQKTSIKEGFSDDPNAVLHMSAMWLLLKKFHKWVFWGFCGIVQNEFFYTELPKSMSSVASNLFEMGLSAAKGSELDSNCCPQLHASREKIRKVGLQATSTRGIMNAIIGSLLVWVFG